MTECKNEVKSKNFGGLSYTSKKAPNKWNDPTAVKCQLEIDIDLPIINPAIELTVFLPYLSDMFPQMEELIIIPMNTAWIKETEGLDITICRGFISNESDTVRLH